MRHIKLAELTSLAACGMAQTPPGFEPAVEANLAVIFDAGAVEEPGTPFTIEETAQLPTIGTDQLLEGTYALMIVDISVPAPLGTDNRETYLHAVITDYTSAAEPDASGLYILENADATGPAPYIGPSPPVETPPYAHSYVQVLFVQPDNWTAPEKDYAGRDFRMGVDVMELMKTFGLGETVAANYFNVTAV